VAEVVVEAIHFSLMSRLVVMVEATTAVAGVVAGITAAATLVVEIMVVTVAVTTAEVVAMEVVQQETLLVAHFLVLSAHSLGKFSPQLFQLS
jgi:hypothetical protein